MELNTKIYLMDNEKEKFMGIGVLWLLESIDESSSLRQAAQKMGLSYSKAYGMLTRLEENLGCPIVERRKGGHSREGIALTPFAYKFIEMYKSFQDRAKALTSELFIDFERELKMLVEEENGGR